MAASFMFATVAATGNSEIILNVLTILFEITGFGFLKLHVRSIYLKLHERYEDKPKF